MNEIASRATGTVTFLFTDIEGSTRLWEEQTEAMHRDLAHHDALLRAAIERHHGHVFKTVGDAFYAAFRTPEGAVEAALEAQRGLRRELHHVRVRMAVHTGRAEARDGDYFGPALNHVARLLAAGHGGQVLLSRATAEQVQPSLPEDTQLRLLGHHRLRDIAASETIFQLAPPDLPSKFPPLNTLDVAFRRGVVRAASVAAIIVAIFIALTLKAVHAEGRANREAARANANAHQREIALKEKLKALDQERIQRQRADAA